MPRPSRRPTRASVRCSLGLDSARRWPGSLPNWRRRPASIGYRRSGTLVVARDRDEAEALDRELALRLCLGLAAERLLPSAARRAEPALAPTVRPGPRRPR